MFRIKNIVLIALALGAGWFGFRMYYYFFDTTSPVIILKGLESEGHYAGNIQCVLSGSDAYKVGDISVWLDKSPLINKFRINRREFDHPFTINSQALSNGKHILKIEAVDGSYRKNSTAQEYVFYVDNTPLQAAFVRPDSDLKVFQGRTLHVQFQVNKDIKGAQVKTLSQTFDCIKESKHSSVYEAYIPIACEETPSEYLLSIDINDHVGNSQILENKYQVVVFPFKKQTLTSAKINKKETDTSLETKIFSQHLEQVLHKSPKEKLWKGTFCIPIEMTAITCEFGTVRTSLDRGRYAHKALDLGAKAKSVVWAAQDGIVAIKDRYEMHGNTVVIDHGYGICTLYCHLDNFAHINVGDRIEKGNPLGVMGNTGYATGAHLHWELLINNVQVDPMQWTKQNF